MSFSVSFLLRYLSCLLWNEICSFLQVVVSSQSWIPVQNILQPFWSFKISTGFWLASTVVYNCLCVAQQVTFPRIYYWIKRNQDVLKQPSDEYDVDEKIKLMLVSWIGVLCAAVSSYQLAFSIIFKNLTTKKDWGPLTFYAVALSFMENIIFPCWSWEDKNDPPGTMVRSEVCNFWCFCLES